MALEIYSKYYRESDDKTIVSVSETDAATFVRFDAELAGNQLAKPNSVLLDRSQSWFSNKYITEYANQKNTEALAEMKESLDRSHEQYDRMELFMKTVSETVNKAILTMLGGGLDVETTSESE
ncbi:hypothetical protein K6V78_02265 [Streptococcus gallolyticus]|nr:hypothetical protein [Streptococcus gallolyticus]MBY5040464.1 hypothetical protein [Streptococcus gallolyticus]